jgi:hypothetical protein
MGALASDALRSEFWQSLTADLESYKQGVMNELLKHSDSLEADNEKRAMVFALSKVLEYPHRLIENGNRARQALEESEKAALNRSVEDRAQAVETLGFNQDF